MQEYDSIKGPASGTDLAGILSKDELDRRIAEVAAKFNMQLDGYFHEKPAKYQVKAEPGFWRNHIDLYSELVGNVWEYAGISYKHYVTKWHKARVIRHMAELLPHHSMALLYSGSIDEVPDAEGMLRNLGYVPVRTEKYAGLANWDNNNQREVLRILRSSEFPDLDAADTRAHQIIDILNERIHPEMYEFAIFTPMHLSRPKSPYDGEELVVNPVKKLVTVPAAWSRTGLENLCTDLALTRAVGVSSRIRVAQGEKHIPMIDFQCWHADEARHVLDEFGMPGMIVCSGNSYHFYGFQLLGKKQWEEFTREAGSILHVDHQWAEFQLKQGYSMLRITPARTKLSQPCFLRFYEPRQRGKYSDIDSKEDAKPEAITNAA